MEGRSLARAVGLGRIGFGVALVLAPERFTRLWLGRDSGRAGTQVAARGLGGRDVVLGLGALMARGPALRGWVAGAVAADLTDFVATIGAGRGVPARGRLAVGALALTGATAGAAALAGLGPEHGG